MCVEFILRIVNGHHLESSEHMTADSRNVSHLTVHLGFVSDSSGTRSNGRPVANGNFNFLWGTRNYIKLTSRPCSLMQCAPRPHTAHR